MYENAIRKKLLCVITKNIKILERENVRDGKGKKEEEEDGRE